MPGTLIVPGESSGIRNWARKFQPFGLITTIMRRARRSAPALVPLVLGVVLTRLIAHLLPRQALKFCSCGPCLSMLILGLWSPLQSHANTVAPATTDPQLPPVILVLGDSLSAAHNIPTEQGWVALLEQRVQASGWQVINASISGETSGGGAARIMTLLAQHPARILVVELGGNDGLRGLPLDQFRHNMQTIIGQAREAGIKVLIAGIQIPTNYGAAYRRRFSKVFTDLAEQFHVPLVPFLLENIADQPELMQGDGIHPVAAAQPQVLENVWPQLQALMEDQTMPADSQ